MRFVGLLALVTLALSVGMSFAHVLEMPVKLRYSPELYAAVNSSLYYGFGTIGAVIVVAAVGLTTGWAVMAWRRGAAGRRWGVAAAVLVWAGLATWWAVVKPVNAEAGRLWAEHVDLERATAETWQSPPPQVAAMWQRRHRQWEYGHAAVFVVNLAAFVALAAGATRPSKR